MIPRYKFRIYRRTRVYQYFVFFDSSLGGLLRFRLFRHRPRRVGTRDRKRSIKTYPARGIEIEKTVERQIFITRGTRVYLLHHVSSFFYLVARLLRPRKNRPIDTYAILTRVRRIIGVRENVRRYISEKEMIIRKRRRRPSCNIIILSNRMKGRKRRSFIRLVRRRDRCLLYADVRSKAPLVNCVCVCVAKTFTNIIH